MSRKQIDILLLRLSVGAFGIMSASFLLMSIESISILAGGLFWIGLLTGLILQVVLEMRRRNFFAQCHSSPKKMQGSRIGLLTFFANREATIADSILVCSVIFLVLSLWLTRGTGYLCYVLIAATAFMLCMHCIFNGRIYFYVMNQTKIQRMLEKKKERKIRKEREHNVL